MIVCTVNVHTLARAGAPVRMLSLVYIHFCTRQCFCVFRAPAAVQLGLTVRAEGWSWCCQEGHCARRHCTALPACLPACLSGCLPAFLPACLPACPTAWDQAGGGNRSLESLKILHTLSNILCTPSNIPHTSSNILRTPTNILHIPPGCHKEGRVQLHISPPQVARAVPIRCPWHHR